MKQQPRQNRIKKNIKHPGHGSFGPVTPKEAGQIAGHEAGAKWNPVIHQEQRQIRASGVRQKQITNQYGQLAGQIQNAAGETDASYAMANAALQANQKAAAEAAANEQSQIAGGNASFAKLTGADPSAFAQGTQERAAAAAQRQISSQALAAPIAQAGAAQAGYLRDVGINARHEGIYQRGQESKRAAQIKEDLLTSRKEKGAEAGVDFNNLRQQEIENQTKREAFNLEKKGAKVEAGAQARKEAREDQELQNETFKTHHPNAGDSKNGLTPSEKHSQKASWNNARASARTLFESKEWPDWTALTRAVQKESEVAPAMAKRAVERIRKHVEKTHHEGKNRWWEK